ELGSPRRIRGTGSVDGDLHGQQMSGSEAGIDGEKAGEAVKEESATGEEEEGEGHFTGDQEAANAECSAGCSAGAAPLLERIVHVTAGGLPCGNQACERAADDGQDDGEPQ